MSDLITEKVQGLEEYKNSEFLILSVYLDLTDLKRPFRPALRRRFKKLVEENLEKAERKACATDLEFVDSYLEEFTNTHLASGIAIFSGGDVLWEVITTKKPISNFLSLGHSPNLLPLKNKPLSLFSRETNVSRQSGA